MTSVRCTQLSGRQAVIPTCLRQACNADERAQHRSLIANPPSHGNRFAQAAGGCRKITRLHGDAPGFPAPWR